ncbi:hypothetical protein QTJ16_003366 [Diplocarpon rosae]|uniref:Uncharacterized protein n=1 Tax=Diplocarpon rosae TaxID=946125 RepID=A0AAD9T126_9HELO|nr:hypothetical protein QTJ16_003366 [Diplocarpon rosae]
MSSANDQARKDVNKAIASIGSAGIGQLVDTATSSKRKREENRAAIARREKEVADKEKQTKK